MYRKNTMGTAGIASSVASDKAKFFKEQMLLEEQMRLANLMQTPENQPPQETPWMRAAKMGSGGVTRPLGGVLGMFLQKIMEQHYQNNPPQPLMGQPVGQPNTMDQDKYLWYMDPGKVRDVY